jgi:hypothetical protein
MSRTILGRLAALEGQRPAPDSPLTEIRREIVDLMREEGMTEAEITAEMNDLDCNPNRDRPFSHLTDAQLDERIARAEAECQRGRR